MTSVELSPTRRPPRPRQPRQHDGGGRARTVVGGLYLSTGGVHLGIVVADTEFYRHFAAGSLLPFVRNGWENVFMAAPVFWGLCLAVGETVLGICLLVGGRAARWGWAGVIAFQVLLVLFGPGFLLWSVPALAVLLPLACRDWSRPTTRRGGR